MYRGEAQLHPTVAAKLMQEVAESGRQPAALDSLTDREMDVLRLIARGMSNKEIALELGVAEKTVKTHVSNMILIPRATINGCRQPGVIRNQVDCI